MGHIMPSTFILTFIPSAAKSGVENRATIRRLKNKNRTLLLDLISTSFLLFHLASYLSNLQQNNFNNVYLAKTPRPQRKIFSYFSELGVLCAFARVIYFPIRSSTIQLKISNIFA